MHKPNVTVACVVRCGSHFLMVKERDKHTKELVYNQPAGHLEKDETLVQAATRELLEETGLNFDISGLVGIYSLQANNGVHYLRFCFYAQADDMPEPAPDDSDIISAHWLTVEQIRQLPLRAPIVEQCIEDSMSAPLIGLERLKNYP